MDFVTTFQNITMDVCLSMTKDNKKYKKEKMKEIISSFTAVLNSNGGRVSLALQSGTTSDVQNLKRAIEQRLSDILGFSSMRDHIELVSSRTDELVYTVEGAYRLCTMNYNLYIPTETQATAVPPKTPIADVKEMLPSQKCIVEMKQLVEIGTHCKEFVYEQNIGNPRVESKTVQFKKLKAEKSKCVTLGDRMTNKANKFANYVSAFANHRGGHIYYGVQDDGVVKGELVEDKEEITKKVSKAINKMVWPTECEGPKRGQHWEIFFEPVHDVNGVVVPSTFVIVVYIARCAGGVFTEEPESYHAVDSEVRRIESKAWREMIFQTTLQKHVKRLRWSSERNEKRFYSLLEKMVYLRNSGEKKDFKCFVRQEWEMTSNSYVNLTILSQRSVFASRRNELEKAKKFIKAYDDLLKDGNIEDHMIFGCVGVYIKSTLERSAAKHKESFDLATSGLQNVELIPAGLCSAWFYSLVASLLTTLACEELCEDRCAKIALAKTFYEKALEHVSHVSGFPKTVLDVQQYIYIHLAFLHLACCVNGTMEVTVVIPEDDFTRAKNCLMMVEKLILEGHALSSLRQIQYLLAKSSLLFRQSQLSISTQQLRRPQLESSLRFSEKALNLALQCHFGEFAHYSCQQKKCVTEEILRDGVRNSQRKVHMELDEELLNSLHLS